MEWSEIWSGATTVFTFGLLLVTGIYAWLTYKLVQASEQQAWEISRPRVVVALQSNQGGQFLLLHIENTGLTGAENLRLSVDRPVRQQFGANNDITAAPIFQDGLKLFQPRLPIRLGLGVAHAYLNEGVDRNQHPLSFTVTAEYSGAGRRLQEVFPIEVEAQLSSTLIDRDYAEEFSRTFPDKFERQMKAVVGALKARKP